MSTFPDALPARFNLPSLDSSPPPAVGALEARLERLIAALERSTHGGAVPSPAVSGPTPVPELPEHRERAPRVVRRPRAFFD